MGNGNRRTSPLSEGKRTKPLSEGKRTKPLCFAGCSSAQSEINRAALAFYMGAATATDATSRIWDSANQCGCLDCENDAYRAHRGIWDRVSDRLSRTRPL